MEKMIETSSEMQNASLNVSKSFNPSSVLCALYDVKEGRFGKIFEAPTEQSAQRMFVTLLTTNERSNITDYPQDFSLYILGSFDCFEGTFDIYKSPYQIMTGVHARQLALDLMKGKMEDVLGKQVTDSSESSDVCGENS